MNLKPSKETMKSVDNWTLRVGRGTVLAVLGWIAVTFYQTQLEVARISRELLVVRPADVLRAVEEVKRETLSKEEIQDIVQACAPWGTVEKDWIQWRFELEGRIKLQTEILSQTVMNLKDMEHTKLDEKDFARWLSELKQHNPEVTVPSNGTN